MLEDDMDIIQWPSTELLASAPLGWEILQLYSLGSTADQLYLQSDPPLWVTWNMEKELFNTGAYLINKAGMQQVRCHDLRPAAR